MMRVLQIISTLRMAYGGPVFFAAALDRQINALGHQSRLLILDKPTADDVPASNPIYVDRFGGNYAFSTKAIRWVIANIGSFDTIIVHGIWQYQSIVAQVAKSLKRDLQILVFIHGALDPWFRRAYPAKHFKKITYWTLLEKPALKRVNCVLFASRDEEKLAKQDFSFEGIKSLTIPFGIEDPNPSGSVYWSDEHRHGHHEKLVFISRIHEKKGLDLLLKALNSDSIFLTFELAIAGSGEQELVAKLHEASTYSGRKDRWLGLVKDKGKEELYKSSDLFCLPSHSENFGLAIAESLAYGLPVLITYRVNIWEDIARFGAGIVVEDSQEGMVSGLRTWLNMKTSERIEMRKNARNCFEHTFQLVHSVRAVTNLIADGAKT